MPANEPTIKREPVIKEIHVARATAHQHTDRNNAKKVNPATTNTSTLVAQNQPIAIKQLPAADTTVRMTSPSQEQPVSVAVIKKHRQHAVNVLDIENEDRQFMINEAPVGTYSNPILARMHLITSPDAIAGNDRSYPLQGIFVK